MSLSVQDHTQLLQRQDTKSINYLKQGFSYQVRGDICVDLEYIVVPRHFHDVFLLLNMSDE